MKNFVQRADAIHTVLGNTVKGGDVVVLGGLVGVAVSDGNGTDLCTVQTKGVFNLPKADTITFTQGATVYWDATNKNCTSTATDNTALGLAWKAAASADESVEVALSNSL